MKRAYKYKIKPTVKQQTMLSQFFGQQVYSSLNILKRKTMMSYDELVEENKLLRKDIKDLKKEVKMLRYTVDRLMASINLMYEAGMKEDEYI